MSYVHSFPPIANRDARVLILGSMPGKASLRAKQYYAHPQNVFWKIIGEVTGVAPEWPYRKRIVELKKHRIALWDVLKSCTRESSLDSDIDNSSIVPNDLEDFLCARPHIAGVFFNGAKAEQVFRKHILPGFGEDFSDIRYERLPSTSPANASIPYKDKLRAWKTILR